MTTRTGAELLVQHLEAQGVEYIFTIPGAKIDKILDALIGATIPKWWSAGTSRTRR